jgi:hypothetical protein
MISKDVNRGIPADKVFEDTTGASGTTGTSGEDLSHLKKKKSQSHMVRLTVKIPMDMKVRLMTQSVESNSPVSWLVRKYITEGLDSEGSEGSE